MTYTLVIHGGAGNIHPKRMEAGQEEALAERLHAALQAGDKILAENGNALDAVEAAVKVLEDSPLFNAGKGSVYTSAATHEMDACMMDGHNRNAGAVSCVGTVRNPVTAARKVLEASPHVLLCGKGAESFAAEQGCNMVEPDYFYDAHRLEQLKQLRGTDALQLDFMDEKYGTVGAVACDVHGNLAAATSTGGMTNKRIGRIGDTPIIGAGCYADNATCAVSCTGQGEYFMRGLIAADVANRMHYQQADLEKAAHAAIEESLKKLEGTGGLIAVDAQGNYAMPFNTTGMFRGVVQSGQPSKIAMYRAKTWHGEE